MHRRSFQNGNPLTLILQLKSWIDNEQVSYKVDGKETVFEGIEMTPENKYSILRKVCTSTEIPIKDLVLFYETQLENDENKDLASRCKISCQTAIYDKDNKEKVKIKF